MKIAVISDWFSEKMGYSENCLPKALASLGHEVHLITSNVQPYFHKPSYKETYEPFIGPGVVACGVKQYDGYTLHRLPLGQWRGRRRIEGLVKCLSKLRPQIVQTFDIHCLSTYEAAFAQPWLGYRLFLETHVHASVFSTPANVKKRMTFRLWDDLMKMGRLVSFFSKKCYPISSDAAEIAIQFYGVDKKKIQKCSLGVDTDLFRPLDSDASRKERQELRAILGFKPDDVVCIYTGRFAQGKDPLSLARAIDLLVVQGQPFRALFVGNGTSEEVAAIQACRGCVVHPFVPFRDLAPFYHVADIGVWPRQESTSQLDAIACGLPIILSNRVQVGERVDGNGLLYEEGNVLDLAQKIGMLIDQGVRQEMGYLGSQKAREHFSWNLIARQRILDYIASLEN